MAHSLGQQFNHNTFSSVSKACGEFILFVSVIGINISVLHTAMPKMDKMQSSTILDESRSTVVKSSKQTQQVKSSTDLSKTVKNAESIMPAEGVITSTFGPRWGRHHNGIDIANDIGTPVLAFDDGKIISTGYESGYGNYIEIQHDEKTTLYGHLDQILVGEGDEVAKGQQIGKMGNTGRSTGPHLHFEISENGVPIDPLPRLPPQLPS